MYEGQNFAADCAFWIDFVATRGREIELECGSPLEVCFYAQGALALREIFAPLALQRSAELERQLYARLRLTVVHLSGCTG